MAKAGYPVGVLIAPIFLYENWREDYLKLLKKLQQELIQKEMKDIAITFEVITHRYTTTAKNKILDFYPETTLPMSKEERKYKYGQFGYGKYVYQPEEIEKVKIFFKEQIEELFIMGKLLYTI